MTHDSINFVVEVKSWHTLCDHDNAYKFKYAKEYLNNINSKFIVLTQDELNEEHLIKVLSGSLRIDIPYLDYEFRGLKL